MRHKLLLVILAIVGALPAAAFAAPPGKANNVGYRRMTWEFATAAGEKRSRQLDLWYPTEAKEQKFNYLPQQGFAAKDAAVAPGKHPVLIFSHGFLGTSDQSIFLTESCARQGYIVAAMNHGDSLASKQRGKFEAPKFAEGAKWTDEKYRDRREDVVALLDQLLAWNKDKAADFAGRIDAERIGGLGHSLGGYTILGLAGGWPSWKDDRIKAAVLLSPYAMPYPVNGDLAKVKIPVMLQGGTLDWGITPLLPDVYKKLGGPKASLVLKNETHFGWTNLISLGKTTTDAAQDGNAELMVDYTIAFFDQHLCGQDCQAWLKQSNERLKSWDYED